MNRAVARPNAPRPQAVTGPRPPGLTPEAMDAADIPPHADLVGSIVCLIGLGTTAFFLGGVTPVDVARFAAVGVLISIGASMVMDMKRGVQNVVRTDVMAIVALYFLTLAEFLVKQGQYNGLANMETTRTAVLACICACAGMVVGRHIVPLKRNKKLQQLFQQPVPSPVLFGIFWSCLLIGFLNMMMAVDFNIPAMIDWFIEPRFDQPWQRGRLGDWKAMLYELSMLLYLVPPLGAILIAQRRKYSWISVFLVLLGVLFTLFYGFSSGTRNVFASYLVTFLIGYIFAANRRQTMEMVAVGVICVATMLFATKVMLDFRDVGLKQYIEHRDYEDESHLQEGQSLAVDNNLYAISRVVDFFPEHHEYTWFEIPYLALIHPIPRVLWPKKPEGMSVSVEDIFAAKGYTVATSVVGEEYIMHGFLAVFLMSMFFGACCAWWNLLASPRNSEYGVLVYASGFFSAVITMRSMNWFSTALLPTAAGLLVGWLFLRRKEKRGPVAIPTMRGMGQAGRRGGVAMPPAKN